MNRPPSDESLKKISGWIRDAATAEPWRPGHHLQPSSPGLTSGADLHGGRVQAALARARRKTFVPMLKPLRRFFRNQAAVNDSLIEAVHYLALQNEEKAEEIARLQDLLSQLRRSSRPGAQLPAADGDGSEERRAEEN